MRRREIEIGGKTYNVEYAGSPFGQIMGMRGRREGKMLFRMPSERRWRIDMALVLSDLHMYFIDSSGKVVDVRYAEKGGLNPFNWSILRPDEGFKYLLESSTPLPITEGDRFEIK
jgi:uncharacterized membrane protein (UPF0127 family)